MNKTPRLRFPEFSGEWNQKRLGDVFPNVRNGFVGTATPFYVDKGICYLQSNNIRKNKFDKTKMVYITNEFHERNEKSKLKTNDILMVQSGHAGECAVVTEEFNSCNCHALIVMTPEKNINSNYCAYFINSDLGQRKISILITGNTIKHILASDIKEFNISLPSINEQEKIANFFLLIDKKIEKQQEKVEALEEYKKGIMQKIFSQEIRFKYENGNDYPEWKEKKAVELFDNVSDKNHDGDLEVLSVTQDRGVIPRSELDIDIKFEASSVASYKRVKKDDFIISLRSFQGGIEISKIEGLISPAYTVFKVKDKKNIDSDFFALIFKSQNFINRLNTLIYGIRDGKAISFNDFSQVKLSYPSIKEQEKIVELFKAMNKKINSEKQKLKQLKKYKKGLLQQMFV